GADRGAVALHGLLRGAGDVRVAGEAEVVVARPVDHRAPADDRGVVGDALVDVEVRVLQSERGGQAQALLELLDFGEEVDSIVGFVGGPVNVPVRVPGPALPHVPAARLGYGHVG